MYSFLCPSGKGLFQGTEDLGSGADGSAGLLPGQQCCLRCPFLRATRVVLELVTRRGIRSCSRSAVAIARDSRVGSSSPDAAVGSVLAPWPPPLPQPGLQPALFISLVFGGTAKTAPVSVTGSARSSRTCPAPVFCC